ncbi:hypothetical protein [Thalassomonas actiniarum]|uniref:Uncharacterized protein n=1 Tax=Thalassomonas actiniarum TaxID=485447 RepID=A0AAE9YSS7_9GAMM|nr:hypothetical protein [Thalassomonas actiniarum]WDD99633.1 hypothetical protein SG35_002870 [Thalassomonas actiniarum]
MVPIDYSKYSSQDLLDVKENIDAEKYPERYQRLCAELELRHKNGELDQLEDEDEDEDDEDDFFIEFSSEGKGAGRILFICAFVLANLAVLAFIIPKYIVTDIADMHKYNATIDFIECHKEEILNEETERVTTYFDLIIGVDQDAFSALSISAKRCKTIANNLSVGTEVSIWHEEGLIHQLASNNRTLLPYQYMKPKVRKLKADSVDIYWVGLLLLWVLSFKSLVNAVIPGTFTADKEA